MGLHLARSFSMTLPSDPFHLQQTVPSPTALNLAAIQSQVRKERECMHLLESVLTKKFVLLLYRFVSEW